MFEFLPTIYMVETIFIIPSVTRQMVGLSDEWKDSPMADRPNSTCRDSHLTRLDTRRNISHAIGQEKAKE